MIRSPARGGDDPDFEVYQRFAHSTSLRIADLILIVAIILLTVAVVGIARSLEGADLEVFARLGALFGVVGGTIAIAQFGLESYAYRLQSQVFEGARRPDVRSAFWAANAVDHVNNGLFITWTLVFLGIAPFVIGLGMARSRSGRHGSASSEGSGARCAVSSPRSCSCRRTPGRRTWPSSSARCW